MSSADRNEAAAPPTVTRRTRGDERRRRVFVVEVDDSFGAPLRHDRPNLYAGRTARPLAAHIDRLITGSAGPAELRGHVVRDRPDLYQQFGPTARRDARRQLRRLVCGLIRRSYRVVGHAPHRVYVVELDPSQAHPGLDRPWVYVGVTSKTPEERLTEHLSGVRNDRGPIFSRVVHRHGVRLLPDLYADRSPTCKRDAARLERELALELHGRGFLVAGDGLPPELRRGE